MHGITTRGERGGFGACWQVARTCTPRGVTCVRLTREEEAAAVARTQDPLSQPLVWTAMIGLWLDEYGAIHRFQCREDCRSDT
jgi:hypothetical protein